MDQPLLFLIKLAWESRYRLPLLITIGFMVLDIRMQLEINIHSRRVQRGAVPRHNNNQGANNRNGNGLGNDNVSESSGDSWFTLDEEEVSGESDAESPDERNRHDENELHRHVMITPAELNNVNVEN